MDCFGQAGFLGTHRLTDEMDVVVEVAVVDIAVELIHLDHTVDLSDEPEACEESNSSCEEEKADDHDAGVSKVEEGGGGPLDVQLRHEVVHAVDGQVERSETGRQEAAPPPVIVLGTEVEVAEEDGGLGAGDHQDQVNQEQEPIHVVYLG